jgi:hypothetical protein
LSYGDCVEIRGRESKCEDGNTKTIQKLVSPSGGGGGTTVKLRVKKDDEWRQKLRADRKRTPYNVSNDDFYRAGYAVLGGMASRVCRVQRVIETGTDLKCVLERDERVFPYLLSLRQLQNFWRPRLFPSVSRPPPPPPFSRPEAAGATTAAKKPGVAALAKQSKMTRQNVGRPVASASTRPPTRVETPVSVAVAVLANKKSVGNRPTMIATVAAVAAAKNASTSKIAATEGAGRYGELNGGEMNGAISVASELSGACGTVVLTEHLEQHPCLLQVTGMSTSIAHYWRAFADARRVSIHGKTSSNNNSTSGNKPNADAPLRRQELHMNLGRLGEKSNFPVVKLELEDVSPLALGDLDPGDFCSVLDTTLYVAPVREHSSSQLRCCYLLVKLPADPPTNGPRWRLNCISEFYAVGQLQPKHEVPLPYSKLARHIFDHEKVELFVERRLAQNQFVDVPLLIRMFGSRMDTRMKNLLHLAMRTHAARVTTSLPPHHPLHPFAPQKVISSSSKSPTTTRTRTTTLNEANTSPPLTSIVPSPVGVLLERRKVGRPRKAFAFRTSRKSRVQNANRTVGDRAKPNVIAAAIATKTAVMANKNNEAESGAGDGWRGSEKKEGFVSGTIGALKNDVATTALQPNTRAGEEEEEEERRELEDSRKKRTYYERHQNRKQAVVNMCVYESMAGACYRLRHILALGVMDLTGLARLMALFDPATHAAELRVMSHIQRELQLAPWSQTHAFAAGKSRGGLLLSGRGNTLARDCGFALVMQTGISYNKIPKEQWSPTALAAAARKKAARINRKLHILPLPISMTSLSTITTTTATATTVSNVASSETLSTDTSFSASASASSAIFSRSTPHDLSLATPATSARFGARDAGRQAALRKSSGTLSPASRSKSRRSNRKNASTDSRVALSGDSTGSRVAVSGDSTGFRVASSSDTKAETIKNGNVGGERIDRKSLAVTGRQGVSGRVGEKNGEVGADGGGSDNDGAVTHKRDLRRITATQIDRVLEEEDMLEDMKDANRWKKVAAVRTILKQRQMAEKRLNGVEQKPTKIRETREYRTPALYERHSQTVFHNQLRFLARQRMLPRDYANDVEDDDKILLACEPRLFLHPTAPLSSSSSSSLLPSVSLPITTMTAHALSRSVRRDAYDAVNIVSSSAMDSVNTNVFASSDKLVNSSERQARVRTKTRRVPVVVVRRTYLDPITHKVVSALSYIREPALVDTFTEEVRVNRSVTTNATTNTPQRFLRLFEDTQSNFSLSAAHVASSPVTKISTAQAHKLSSTSPINIPLDNLNEMIFDNQTLRCFSRVLRYRAPSPTPGETQKPTRSAKNPHKLNILRSIKVFSGFGKVLIFSLFLSLSLSSLHFRVWIARVSCFCGPGPLTTFRLFFFLRVTVYVGIVGE